jgi:hypothetical protein
MSRITTTHAVADRNSRVASELARIRAWSKNADPRAKTRWMDASGRTRSYQNKRASAVADQQP